MTNSDRLYLFDHTRISARIGVWVRKGIQYMLEFYKRAWQAFLAAFIGSVATAAFLFRDYKVGFNIMLIISTIFLILFLIGLYHDYRDARRKDTKEKQEIIHKALVESFKRLGMTDKQAEEAATGRTEPYQPIEGLDDNGWLTPIEAYKKHKKNKRP